ncbi:MAG: sigma-54-dependent Fis family transcriptional regulator [Myxococcales bacterium FL481]|nr:MAG: sigma-54-dependent Fis family transcriptional regulator [Myxococcales bacterium FL481]
MRPRILVIDDNEDIATAIRLLLEIQGFECLSARTPEEGLRRVQSEPFDLVIQDMNFGAEMTSGVEGVALFERLRTASPDLPIILITAWTHLETAVSLVKSGAADYLAKPWEDDKLVTSVRNLLELSELQHDQRQAGARRRKRKADLAARFDLCGVVFESEAMLTVVDMATRVAHSDASVLITGPNGSGKEKIAEIVQANSSCAQGPFVRVNIGALSPSLLEAELFGAEPGAYTGSAKRRAGRFELADGGTLFLDEIGNLPLDGQMKLLRVLETGQFERLGGTETLTVNVRVISATNADLRGSIADRTFREDLYYRLNTIQLDLPPLRERSEDVLPLAQSFLAPGWALDESARDRLRGHNWPGNVRELRSSIKRGMLLAPGPRIAAEHLGLGGGSNAAATPHSPTTRSRDEPSQTELLEALRASNGTVSDAARMLGLSRSALYRRMKKFGIGES